MQFTRPGAELFIPNNTGCDAALAAVTHMAIGAHHDDLEIMAPAPIIACYRNPSLGFLGVVATDGAGSARTGPYAHYNDDEMRTVRIIEQRAAAVVGEYSAVAMLNYPSMSVKQKSCSNLVTDLSALLQAARPRELYIHNLADKHPTHVAVALRSIEAVRALPLEERPARVLGCEVWRNLDWMLDADKQILTVPGHENLFAALVGVFDSQIAGGKRYDLAAEGRMRANATFHHSHSVDAGNMLSFAMDLTPLAQDDTLDPAEYVAVYMDRTRSEVLHTIRSFAV